VYLKNVVLLCKYLKEKKLDMLKNVTEKKIPQNPTKIVILKKHTKKFPKVSRTEKKIRS